MTLRGRVGVGVLVALPLIVLAVFFGLPIAGMLARGVWPDGHFAPHDVLAVLGRPRTVRVLWFTVWSAGLAAAAAVLLGVPTAFALYRLRFPGRGLIRAIVVVPFVLPTVVVGVAFRQLLGGAGPLGFLHLDGTAAAIVAALAFFNISVVVRTVGSFWEGLDPRREQAAAALGASPRQVFLTVTLPALAPAVAAAASVVFLFCATSFGVVLTMGGLRYANVETEIYLLTTQELDLPAAAALSLLQIALVTGLLLAVRRGRRHDGPLDQATGTARRVRLLDAPVLAVAAAVLVFLVVPLLALGRASLRAGDGWSLASYRALGTTGAHNALLVPATDALATSLLIAVEATALALGLGVVVAHLVSRRPSAPRLRRMVGLLDGVFMLPLGVSAVTLGFGFLITLDRPPLDLRSSPVLIPIAQALVALPLVVRTVAPVWRSVDPRQRQAAASLGASPLRVFWSVDVRAGWRALLAATGFAFAVSLGEFGATSFLARSDQPTMPVVIYQLLGHPGAENFGMAMAASVVLAAATALVMLAVERLRVGSVGAF